LLHTFSNALTGFLAIVLLTACSSDNSARDGNISHTIGELNKAAPAKEREWQHYLGDSASNQFSPLTQVTPANVTSLQEAWRYDSGESAYLDTLIPTNPLIVKGVLYGLSARKNLFALNAATGEELWVHKFDKPYEGKGSGRGLVYWQGKKTNGEDAAWILLGLKNELFAIDAITGEPAEQFGDNGVVDLRVGLDRPTEGLSVNVIAPGSLYGDLLIQGFGTSELYDAAPGYIRAYHIPSGDLRWTFRTIPLPGTPGADTWPMQDRDKLGGANSWAGVTIDKDRGIVFVPTGSAAYDFYGANREGDNLYANSLIALEAETGEYLWHYQFVRHDLWDRDLPTPPNLVTIERDGQRIPAVSQATKTGHLFVFHRETGEPLFPMEEVAVQGSGVPGEHIPTTQPLPLSPPPFARQIFEVTDISPESTEYIEALIKDMATDGPYYLADEDGLVLYPGMDGGAEWGGQAYDAHNNLLILNTQEVAWYYKMVPTTSIEDVDFFSTEFAYLQFCSSCHGANREGNGSIFPSLKNISEKYYPWEVYDIVRNGRGRMPAFTNEPWFFLWGPIFYLYTAEEDEIAQRKTSGQVSGYMANGFHILRDEYGLPGSRPPWGSLVAIDLNRGDIAWKVPLGDYPGALEKGLSGLGAENYGGPVVTATGLVFIAATPDNKLRAFQSTSGEVLWETFLPSAGFATPAIYEANGRQFIVIAAGGGRLGQPSTSTYIAYALPDGPVKTQAK
jgi:quinoprotein glucose dehydrogenase